MGVAYYPVFEDTAVEWPNDINGKCLARASTKLDRVCKRASVPTLCDFFAVSRDEFIAEALGGDPEDPATFDESQVPPERWFGADEGLRSVRLLVGYVREHRHDFAEYNPAGLPDCVLGDLEAFEQALAAASANDIRWRLAIDY